MVGFQGINHPHATFKLTKGFILHFVGEEDKNVITSNCSFFKR